MTKIQPTTTDAVVMLACWPLSLTAGGFCGIYAACGMWWKAAVCACLVVIFLNAHWIIAKRFR